MTQLFFERDARFQTVRFAKLFCFQFKFRAKFTKLSRGKWLKRLDFSNVNLWLSKSLADLLDKFFAETWNSIATEMEIQKNAGFESGNEQLYEIASWQFGRLSS